MRMAGPPGWLETRIWGSAVSRTTSGAVASSVHIAGTVTAIVPVSSTTRCHASGADWSGVADAPATVSAAMDGAARAVAISGSSAAVRDMVLIIPDWTARPPDGGSELATSSARSSHAPGWVAMTTRISHTSVDTHNAYEQSVWWCQVLGFAGDPQDPNRPGDEECMIFSTDGRTRVLFIEVADDKVVKNRVHLDLSPTDRTRTRRSGGCSSWVPPLPPTTAMQTAAAG